MKTRDTACHPPKKNSERAHGTEHIIQSEVACNQCLRNALESWKQVDFLKTNLGTDVSNRRNYRLCLRTFLNKPESDRVQKPCIAAETDKNCFGKSLKGKNRLHR